MNSIDYYRTKAKDLLKDYKAQIDGNVDYEPRFSNSVEEILKNFKVNDRFTLMNAQYVIVRLAGFYKWESLLYATEAERENGRLLFEQVRGRTI